MNAREREKEREDEKEHGNFVGYSVEVTEDFCVN